MKPVSIFISYSHKDENFMTQLSSHLRSLERNNRITSWHDRRIRPGSDWSREIDLHIDQADIVLCLVSPDFVDSDYCWEKEMKRALARHSAKQAIVIPVLIRPVAWGHTPLAGLQGLPPGMMPISESPSRDAAWVTVIEGIMEVTEDIFGARQLVFGAVDILPALREASELIRSAGHFPGDEAVIDEKNWHDLTLLRVHAPVVARAVEDYRRAQAQASIWSKRAADVMQSLLLGTATTTEGLLIASTTLIAENTRRKLGLKLLEAHTLIVFEDGRADGSPGVRSLLDPARYGFTRALPALNDEITLQMTTYAKAVEAAEASLKMFKEIVARVLTLKES